MVPLVMDLIEPRSVVDVGCGLGSWLAEFIEQGIEDVVGVDGPGVPRHALEIPEECFLAADLSQPLDVGRQFDLVLSLEVAEHLPPESAETFVDSLTRLGDAVMFSAAIPFQGGTHHVNEQWPDYWADLFVGRDYVTIDCIRSRIWQDELVEWWYAQNSLLFATRQFLADRPHLKVEAEATSHSQLSLVHPRKYLSVVDEEMKIRLAAREIASLVPQDATFILVDQAQLGERITAGRKALPFLERDGEFWGAPADDDVAIRELRRVREGAAFLVFAWPAFWWLDVYPRFRQHLDSRFSRVLANDRLLAYELSDTREPYRAPV